MNELIAAPVVMPTPPVHPVFPPIYYDQPETQVVLGLQLTADDQLPQAHRGDGTIAKGLSVPSGEREHRRRARRPCATGRLHHRPRLSGHVLRGILWARPAPPHGVRSRQ
jgi:hypothetical protein